MQAAIPLTRDLLLVGGGHAHALVLRRWGMDPLPGVRVTVVNPGADAPYTGMLPGHVAGHYDRDALDIDLVRLARFAGARLIDGAVTGIDAEARCVTVAGRGRVEYDVASLDVGIHSDMPDLPGFDEHGTPAKPLDLFARGWRAHLAMARTGAPAGVAVIGGGVAGIELSMAIAHAFRVADVTARVTVLEAAPDLTGAGRRARRRLLDAMEGLGVVLRTGVAISAIHADHVALAGGETVPAAFVVGATGARAHPWLAQSGLPVHEGFVRVDPTLAVEGRADLFAAGDCAHLTHAPRPKAGVYAVRAAPVLHRNLRAALSGGSLRTYRPQRTYLKLISLGGKQAVAEKAGFAVAGSWLWRWKDRIDRRFMAKLTDLPAMARTPLPAIVADGVRDVTGDAPLCGGCGSKVGAGALGTVLAAMPPPARDDVLSRPGDDAAVLRAGPGRQVFTTDHLRAFTEDHALMARIAAIHALGDIWAMGAAPQAALASLVLPRMSEELQRRTLAEMMAAAGAVLRDAGADLVGGHTTMGAELTVGFAITGLHDGMPIGHGGARPGNALLLTRPIGSGTLLAGEMAGRARGRDVMAALAAMSRPQGDAAAILAGAHAMTDVTGFGLAGHLSAICRASGVGAEIALGDVPVYAGALALAEAGVRSTLHPSNVAAAPVIGALGPRGTLLHDPQTAGGLLAAVDPETAPSLVERLRTAGHDAVRIGTITEDPVLRCL
ncbi:selenide, water dikinase SelD [uncultured Jannaschia sp.]|uniref:selenide, water dikinase SelD n=1 Tax=uncultured Jannaschia sp. TaxID=293347 RepID=UPI0026209C99|nr:selenide, water dikinase SelD [uncultured Jannaschia sp.]